MFFCGVISQGFGPRWQGGGTPRSPGRSRAVERGWVPPAISGQLFWRLRILQTSASGAVDFDAIQYLGSAFHLHAAAIEEQSASVVRDD